MADAQIAGRKALYRMISVLPNDKIPSAIDYIRFLSSDSETQMDPFYSETNQSRLRQAAKDMDSGKWTVHELIENDDD
jgi:hypothetical protein